MLTPENLEKLIAHEKTQCENWLWDQMAPSAELLSPLKEICKQRLQHHKSFGLSNFILLVGKSLTPQLSMGLLHFACLCELMAVAQSLKQEALTAQAHGGEEESLETSSEVASQALGLPPVTLHLMSDALLASNLEHIAGFNLPRLNEQFARVARSFFEAELLGLHHLDSASEYGGKPEAYKVLAFQQKPLFLKYAAEGAARICGTNLVQTQSLGEYAEQLGMGLSLLRELEHAFSIEESTSEWLNALSSHPFKHLSRSHRYLARVSERFGSCITSEETASTEADATPRHQLSAHQHVLQEAYVHFEKAFSSLMTLNSLHNPTPLLALCEFSMGLCHQFETQLKKRQ